LADEYVGRMGMRTAEVKVTHDFAKRVATDHHDTCRAMAGFGIDYPVLVQQALNGEPRAIRLMLSVAQVAMFDGAVAESFAATRSKVAFLVGDEKLAAAYERFHRGVDYAGIRESFLLGGAANSRAEAEAEISKQLPNFWRVLNERAEQAAAADRPVGDLCYWAALNGIDFPKLMENCLDGADSREQVKAWKLFVWFLDNYGADGAAGEELGFYGERLASQIDTERLARIVAEIPEDQWRHLPFSLRWHFKYDKLSDKEKQRLGERYPVIVRVIKKEILGNADSTTTPESKSKDTE